ncbi:MAG: pyruvate ferredoxin oxidoreductase [Deltaproteobacteria bacterium]|nr:pyruvate ferredoxin oxidoreductase [Deltaproteobacteria bacterium]
MSERKVIMGNHAVSYGVKLARVQVISAYPITPQTQVVEMLSEMCADAVLAAKFLKVESEHSALAAVIGAATLGVRTFTATSAQGLALMHELVHWSAGSRLPLVMADVNRAMAPGWSIWPDQLDALSQRDTGWLQLYCESNQEILDLTLLAYRLAESLSMPVMVVYDAFVLSHTSEPVEIPDQSEVDAYLPALASRTKLDLKTPAAFGGLTSPEYYFEFRYMMQQAHDRALVLMDEIGAEFGRRFGRNYGALETIDCDDAELILVTAGASSSTTRVVVQERRRRGQNIGIVKLRLFRPFPVDAIRRVLRKARRVAVIDRNLSVGCGGIFAQEIRAALCDLSDRPEILGYVAGLGGRDITLALLNALIDDALERKAEEGYLVFWGLKEETLYVER